MKVKFNIAKQFIEPFIQINAAQKSTELQQLAESIQKINSRMAHHWLPKSATICAFLTANRSFLHRKWSCNL